MIFTYTAQGIPVPAYRFNNGGAKVLILGGVHGDEVEGVIAAFGLLDAFTKAFPYKLDLTLVPALNLEGVLNKTRVTSRGIDLNRNLPTKDWSSVPISPQHNPGPSACSETENQALVKYIETEKPKFILSLHSYDPMLNVNGKCLEEAAVLAEYTGYKIVDDIGYPTPGCLGTYAGLERESPTLTYEIERGQDASSILKMHIPAILACLKVTEKKFL